MPKVITSPAFRIEYHVICKVLGHIRTFSNRKLAHYFAGTEHTVRAVRVNLLAGVEPAPF